MSTFFPATGLWKFGIVNQSGGLQADFFGGLGGGALRGTGKVTKYDENWLGPVLEKLEWVQQPNVEKRVGGLYQRNIAFPRI